MSETLNVIKKYSDIKDIGQNCACIKSKRVYVAISKNLNEQAVDEVYSESSLKTSLVPYVFKVGFTKNNCKDRWKSIRENRKEKIIQGKTVYEKPCYAGVDDWKFLKCWSVSEKDYDDSTFKPWLKKSRFKDDVHNIVYAPNSPHMISGRSFVDIFTISEAAANSLSQFDKNVFSNYPLNEQILAAVSKAIIVIVQEYADQIID